MKGMLKKKSSKNGSVILMVLMISTILIILSAVIMNSLIFTTVNNDLVKHKADYVYAAEGGLEAGIEKYNQLKGPFSSFNVDFLKDEDIVEEKDIADVIVEYKEDAIAKKIVSTVVNLKGDTLAKVEVQIGINRSSNDILKYLFCGSKTVDIESGGASSFSQCQIAHNASNGGILNASGAPTKKPDNIVSNDKDPKDIKCDTPKFKDSIWGDAGTIEVDALSDFIGPSTIDGKAIINIDGKGTDAKIESGIGRFELNNLENVGKNPMKGYRLILVNGNVKVNALSGSTNVDKFILIATGDVIFDGAATHSITNGTIYAKNIIIKSTATISAHNSPKYGSGYIMTDGQVKALDVLLDKYMDNWGVNSSGGSVDINYDEIKYEY